MNFKQVIENKIQSPEFMTNIIGEMPLIIKPLDGGHSSIVYGVKLHNGSSFVLKFSENTTELYNEQLFLKTWSQKGIRTPEIIELTQLPEGLGGSVLQMEFVSGQNLFPLMEKGAVDSPKILHDLGVILATMHTVTVTGYGTVNVDSNGSIQGEDKSFSETLYSLEWQETCLLYTSPSPRD